MKILDITSTDPVNEPTLADVLHDLWRARFWLLLGAIAGFIASIVFLLLAVPQYRAQMLTAPTTHAGSADISGLFPENAGLAMEMALQSFGPGDSGDFMRFESIVREPTVAARLLQYPAIRKGLSQARRWSFLPAPSFDSPAQLAAWLQDNLEIEPVGTTRLKRMAFRHPDPAFAVLMLQTLYQTADDLIRSEVEAKTVKRIAYLEKTLDQMANPDHRREITKLLMDQEQIATILAVHEPYAAAIAEPPAAGAHADWPRRSVVFPSCMLVAMVLAYMLYGLRRLRD